MQLQNYKIVKKHDESFHWVQVTNIKRCLISLYIKEMQIKVMASNDYTLIRIAKIKTGKNIKCQ